MFAEGSGCGILSSLDAGGYAVASRDALADALPAHVGADAASSVAVCCDPERASTYGRMLDSAAGGLLGVAQYADWAAAAAAGLATARAVTVPLLAGPRVVGFIQLHFSLFEAAKLLPPGQVAHPSTAGSASSGTHPARQLRSAGAGWDHLLSVAEALGSALFVGRAFATAAERAPASPGTLLVNAPLVAPDGAC